MAEIIHTFVVLAYKESIYLERCIKSVLNQKYKSKVLIATSTLNDHIKNLARKYNLSIKVNDNTEKGIGADFNYAISAADTKLVTIAHQDDIYDEEYSHDIVKYYNKNKECSIIFTKYYDIKGNEKIYESLNFKVKSILLWPLNISNKARICKRLCLAFGDSIGCPTVTFVNGNFELPVFDSYLKCNVDWAAWEKLSKQKYAFGYIKKHLMGHRIHEQSTTTDIINANIRTKEDYEIYKAFWPAFIARLLVRAYKASEKNNDIAL